MRLLCHTLQEELLVMLLQSPRREVPNRVTGLTLRNIMDCPRTAVYSVLLMFGEMQQSALRAQISLLPCCGTCGARSGACCHFRSS